MELITLVVADGTRYISLNMIYHNGMNFTKSVVSCVVHVTMISLYLSKTLVFLGYNVAAATVQTMGLQPAARQVYYVASNHICKLCIYLKNYTIIWAIRCTTYGYWSTCCSRTSPQYLRYKTVAEPWFRLKLRVVFYWWLAAGIRCLDLSVTDVFVGPVNLKCALNIGYATMERNPSQFCSIQQADQSVKITNPRRESGEQ